MMGFNFPTSPSVGAIFQPGAGLPTYKWDGEKWVATQSYADGGVRYDVAQALTSGQQEQARKNIVAAPFDAMAYSGLQINGGMEVSQEKGTSGLTGTVGYICDGWAMGFSGTMVGGASATNVSVSFPNFPYQLQAGVVTAQASLGAGDYYQILQYIEGWRCARLQWGTANAQPITLCFWSAHHRPGLYTGTITNGPTVNRSYAFTYTHNVADVAQYNVITIPGDTTGTWAVNNTTGIVIHFALGSGTTLITPLANTWLAGGYIAGPGQINGIAATSDVFRLTGVIILPGNEAPSAARSPFIVRPYGEELMLCQRYYEKHILFVARSDVASGQHYAWVPARVIKRAVPTLSLANITYLTASGANVANASLTGCELNYTVSGINGVCSTDVIMDARL